MAHEDSIIYQPRKVWANDVGDYKCGCFRQERPDGSFVITVVENGTELERYEVSAATAEHKPVFDLARELRPKYAARYQAEIGKRQPGR